MANGQPWVYYIMCECTYMWTCTCCTYTMHCGPARHSGQCINTSMLVFNIAICRPIPVPVYLGTGVLEYRTRGYGHSGTRVLESSMLPAYQGIRYGLGIAISMDILQYYMLCNWGSMGLLHHHGHACYGIMHARMVAMAAWGIAWGRARRAAQLQIIMCVDVMSVFVFAWPTCSTAAVCNSEWIVLQYGHIIILSI